MTPEQFVYWLNGFHELGGGAAPTDAQWKSIGEHLALVLKKVTPPFHFPPGARAYAQTDAIGKLPLSEPLPDPLVITC